MTASLSTLAASLAKGPRAITLFGAPEGHDAATIAAMLRKGGIETWLHVCRDDGRMARFAATLAFFRPSLTVLTFPAWDCLPYDRVSPNGEIVSRRIDTLTRLAGGNEAKPLIVLTTVNALVQLVPPRKLFDGRVLTLGPGGRIPLDRLQSFFRNNGYIRTDTVREAGEFAIRGGIVDLFPAGAAQPLRLDFFGDTLESLRSFDPLTQRSSGSLDSFQLRPVSEILLDDTAVQRFRSRYREAFGAVGSDDPLYESVSAGRRQAGMEHWLPFYYETLETLFDYLPDAVVSFDYQSDEARAHRLEAIADFYAARKSMSGVRGGTAPLYRPVEPQQMFLDEAGWQRLLSRRSVVQISPFAVPTAAADYPHPNPPPQAGEGGEDGAGKEHTPARQTGERGDRTAPSPASPPLLAGEGQGGGKATGVAFDAGARPARSFATERADAKVNLFDVVRDYLNAEQQAGRQAAIAAYSEGSADRLATVLRERGLTDLRRANNAAALGKLPPETVGLAILPLEQGFTSDSLALLSEQDILGDRLSRTPRRRRNLDEFITEAASLSEGDLVVHAEHGIGRYEGLETIAVGGAPHDCLRVAYAGDDRLFVPVENIEVLSRFGSEESGAQLDRLGGAGWQARKARVKQRIREIANELIRVAAERQLRPGETLNPPEGMYEEFAARFPYPETDDQLRAIEDTLGDMAAGRPMDRLICGDVGFGKTEVAMRAAFVAAFGGAQVAVIVPTTLLARQHYRNFTNRFAGLPLRVGALSRLVSPKDAKQVKADLAEGKIEIIVGTHALLAKDVKFQNLGLVIVDEEQHFGVSQKERLKQLKADVHVLTLTATPIPRTLQLALSGVREMSIIATPPIDRLAVRTFITPFDAVVLREAILRERDRGGQVFYVAPYVSDLDEVREELRKMVPEIRVAMAHGRMAPTELENVMTAFDERAYDLLLSTNIIESGLDIPSANTMIVHRADRFGLAQLYQLRGRIGRGKIRAYCYLTLPEKKKLAATAQRRLEVMQTLDTLGAGFQLASHDLDIRGAGNLLGDEQSGHIREVGIELYQSMLEEAVATAKTAGPDGLGALAAEDWTPQITIGMPVLIPESYVTDLGVRLGLYRRMAQLTNRRERDAFAAELIDRFGKLPDEVENLLQIIAIKRWCKEAGAERVEAGPKGAVITLRGNRFANPAGLVELIQKHAGTLRLRPDQKLVYLRNWEEPAARLKGVAGLMQALVKLVRADTPAAGVPMPTPTPELVKAGGARR
ncbi:MAG: transcription-repair coupling factor [Alphaproteobacteria bacterium]|nr:transcription-repair coupling factor [Alphaproteobacteria bacterium]